MSISRRWRRLLVGAALMLIGLLAVAMGVKVAGALRLRTAESRFRADVGSLDLTSYGPASTETGREAARRLTGAAQAIVLPQDAERNALLGMVGTSPGRWTPEQRSRLEAVLADNATALTLLREVPARGPVTLSIAYSQGVEAKLPNLLDAMNAAKLVHLDALLALERGEMARALGDVETLGAMASAFERESALIVGLIGIAVERQQVITVREVMADPRLRTEDVDRLRRSLPAEDLRTAFRRAMGMEAASVARLVREGRPEDWRNFGEPPVPGWRAATAVAGDLIVARHLQRVHAIVASLGADAAAVRSVKAQQGNDWPNLVASLPRFALADTLRRLALASLDVRRVGLREGRYPEALPSQHATRDLFTGATFRYARTANGAAVLEAPEAAALFEEFKLQGTRPPFRWELPAPLTGRTKPLE